MHLYTISRGMKEHVDRAIRDLQAQYFVMNNNGKEIPTQFQVRPVQFWEFVFPREHLNTVLATISYKNNEPKMGLGCWKGASTKFALLRKSMHLKKIPELDYSKIPRRMIFNKDIGWHHIGTKEDYDVDGTERL